MGNNLKGTNVSSGIVPFTDQDKYPTHYAKYGKGGYVSVQTISERNSIPKERKEVGMICYVEEDPIHTYQLNSDSTWVPIQLGLSGIPILDKEEKDKLSEKLNLEESKYVYIPTENDLIGEVTNKTITTEANGSYLDIIFSTIRELQAEVAKMRNAFRYGMYSYTGTDTAMSSNVSDIEDPDEEPLWAIEPDTLSFMSGSSVFLDKSIDEIVNLEPLNNIILPDQDNRTYITVTLEGIKWYDNADVVRNTRDSKIFLYLTLEPESGAIPNAKITLKSKEEEGSSVTPTTLDIDLRNLSNKLPLVDKYSILVVLSRETERGGKKYIWISLGNAVTNETFLEGYYDIENSRIVNNFIAVDKNYFFMEIFLSDLNLYQLDFYSKYQEFSQEIMPSKPSDQDYKYRVAHLTIRSVTNKTELLSIQDQLPKNELIFDEETSKLWIKTNNGLVAIVGPGGSSSDDNNNSGGGSTSNMTINELIRELMRLGIVYEEGVPGSWDSSFENLTPGTGNLKLSSISDITFIHQATGKRFNFEVDSTGELKSTELPESGKSLIERLNALNKTNFKVIDSDNTHRGFIAKLHCGEKSILVNDKNNKGLNSDRVRIGSFYTPLHTDKVFGCSHAFIELENSSDKDFPLEGCSLYFYHLNSKKEQVVNKLPLKGILRAGSTFLIRGKKYSDPKTNPSTFINVDDYDMEWYIDGQLADFTIISENVVELGRKPSYGFALIYDVNDAIKVTPVSDQASGKTLYKVSRLCFEDNTDKTNAPRFFPWYYIDSIPLNAEFYTEESDKKLWGYNIITPRSNCIIKNVFELDPAQQALQSLNKYDSSRYRLSNVEETKKTCDIMYLDLSKPEITFPHSEEKYPIVKFTPKSSKQNKNVITDKTSFDLEKPNCVNCSFGIDSHTTRCFNWVSGGEFNEYVWIKKNDDGWYKFESYKLGDHNNTLSSTFPRKKVFSETATNLIYNRITGNFPGCNIHYTSHKCILEFNEVNEKTVYTYVVGRADKDGTAPDINHSSEEYSFTLYPKNGYDHRVYLTTDQQGFHWVEYQVWSASAKKLNELIIDESVKENIIPVLLNSGDMTQNGTRVNEWLDYYNGAKPLLRHLEHMAVVGNNDLCGPDPEILGTGDDTGKSNPFYFHVFNCYEVSENIDGENTLPIINNVYVPSIYYFDVVGTRFLMCNSEITATTCSELYNLRIESNNSSTPNIINAYTGWEVPLDKTTSEDNLRYISEIQSVTFTPIYNILYKILENNVDGSKNKNDVIAVCHEMPFTVITEDCLSSSNNQHKISRSINDKGALVGSHLNQICPEDIKSLYWFSRLCEYFKINLVLGGHKHTYSCTYPLRENYLYGESYASNSKENGPMEMTESLENDKVTFINSSGDNLSKYPIIVTERNLQDRVNAVEDGSFAPAVLLASDSYQKVTYFMCQATGYKQTSNKELPSTSQVFSKLIPNCTGNKADGNQQFPMFAVINKALINGDKSEYHIKLVRISNIQTADAYLFTQNQHCSDDMQVQTAVFETRTEGEQEYDVDGYCKWEGDKLDNIIIKVAIKK